MAHDRPKLYRLISQMLTRIVLEQDEKKLETAEVGRSFVARAESRTSMTMTNDDMDEISSISSEIEEPNEEIETQVPKIVVAKFDDNFAKLESKIESHKKVYIYSLCHSSKSNLQFIDFERNSQICKRQWN